MAKLAKRSTKDGREVYYVDFYFGGKRVRKSTGTGNYKLAKEVLNEIEARITRKTFHLHPKKKVFLKEFLEEFLNFSSSHKADSTWRRDRLVLNSFYCHVGNISLDEIDKRMIDQYMGDRVRKLKKTSVNIDLRHLKAALTKAVDWGYLSQNPAKGIKTLAVPQTAPNFFTELQLKKIIETIDFEPLKEIVIFAANTGVRINELVNIKWTDVHFEMMTVRISQKKDFETKTKRERTIPLNEKAYAILSGIEHRGEYVFSRLDGKKRDKHFITRSFKRTLHSVDLAEGHSFHSLRHTFASLLVQRGVSIYIVSKLLGHSSPKTTEIYAHLAPETYHDAVSLLDTLGRKQYSESQTEFVKVK